MFGHSALAVVLGVSVWAPEPVPVEDVETPTVATPEPPAPDEGTEESAPPDEATEEPVSPQESAPEPTPETAPETTAPPLYTFDPMVSPPSPATATDDEIAPGPDREPPEPASEGFRRRGFLITLGVGLTHCAQDFCSPIRMGGLGRLELGYRLTRLALVATVTGGGGRADDPESDEQSIRTLDAAAGVLLLPVRQGPVDPFMGATLGYARTSRVYREDAFNERQIGKRGALRLSGGILWHVTSRLALGPRFDVRLPFAGNWCTVPDADNGGMAQCQSIRDELIRVDDSDKSAERKRSDRRAFPRPWALTFDLRITI